MYVSVCNNSLPTVMGEYVCVWNIYTGVCESVTLVYKEKVAVLAKFLLFSIIKMWLISH